MVARERKKMMPKVGGCIRIIEEEGSKKEKMVHVT